MLVFHMEDAFLDQLFKIDRFAQLGYADLFLWFIFHFEGFSFWKLANEVSAKSVLGVYLVNAKGKA